MTQKIENQVPTFGEHRFTHGIIIESWRLWEGINTCLDIKAERVSDWRLDTDYFVLEQWGNVSAGVVVAQGASFCADALERFVGCDAKAVVRIGTCGGIAHSARIGDIVVPYAAVREEGTSRFYLPPNMPAHCNFALAERFIEVARPLVRQQIHPSVAWTTDGRWCQSDQLIQKYSDLGITSVDMETSALFAAGMLRGVATLSVSIVGDTPIKQLGQQFKGIPQSESDWYDLIVANAALSWQAVLQTFSIFPG